MPSVDKRAQRAPTAACLIGNSTVTQWLAVFGLFSATLVFAAALLVLSGIATQLSPPVVLTAMPIFFFEMAFAGWLIVKGFNSSAVASESAIMEAHALLGTA